MAACDVWKQTHKNFKDVSFSTTVQCMLEAQESSTCKQDQSKAPEGELVSSSIFLTECGNSIDSYHTGNDGNGAQIVQCWNTETNSLDFKLNDYVFCNIFNDLLNQGQVNLADLESDSDHGTVFDSCDCDEDDDTNCNYFENTHFNCLPVLMMEWHEHQYVYDEDGIISDEHSCVQSDIALHNDELNTMCTNVPCTINYGSRSVLDDEDAIFVPSTVIDSPEVSNSSGVLNDISIGSVNFGGHNVLVQQQQCDTHRIMDGSNSCNDASLPVSNSINNINSKNLDKKNNDWCSMRFSFKKNTGESGGSDNTYENANKNNENNINNICNEKEIQLQLHFPDNCLFTFCHLDGGIILYSEIIKLIKNLLPTQNLDEYHIILCDDLMSFVNSNDKIDYAALSRQTRMENKWNNDTRIIFFSQVIKILIPNIPVSAVLCNDITNWNGYHVLNDPQKGNICEVNNKTNKMDFDTNNNLSSLNFNNTNNIIQKNYKKKRGKKKRYKWVAKNRLQNPKLKTFAGNSNDSSIFDKSGNDTGINGTDYNRYIHSNDSDGSGSNASRIIEDVLNSTKLNNNIFYGVTARAPPYDPDIIK